MFIQTEATPNPATLKFIPGRTVLDTGTMEFSSREAAARSPLAERLFSVPGVTSVFYGSDFVTVTKAEGEWQQLKPAILGAIMEHYMSGAPLLADGTAASSHGLGMPDALRLGRALGQLPRRMVILAVEAADTGAGTELSKPVATALPEVVAAVMAELKPAKSSG